MKFRFFRRALACAAALLCLLFTGCGSEQPEALPTAADGAVIPTVDVLQFRQPAQDSLVAIFDTAAGEFSAVLYPDAAPQAVQNFVTLAQQGAYDGLDFHRVIEDFIIQSGDTNGYGGASIWGSGFAPECSDLVHHYTGALAMAGSEENHSQFFVVNCPADSVPAALQEQMRTEGWSEDVITAYAQVGGATYLDNIHTVFGQVFYGLDTVRAIGSTGSEQAAVLLNSVKITDYGAWQATHPEAEPAFYSAAGGTD